MIREKLYWVDAVFRIESLCIYKKLQEDVVVKNLYELCKKLVIKPDAAEQSLLYYTFLNSLIEKAEALGLSGNIFNKYMIYLFMNDENAFSLACEKNKKMSKTSSIYEFALKDIVSLKFFLDFDLKNICDNIGYKENTTEYTPLKACDNSYYKQLEQEELAENILELLMKYYIKTGCGELGRHGSFRFDGTALIAEPNDRQVTFSNLIGFEYEKSVIINNTKAFLAGSPHSSLILAGAAGTGKSSCVRALSDMFYDSGLRLVELPKEYISVLEPLLRQLSERGKHFIIFIKDLSVGDAKMLSKYFNEDFTNIQFYITSNEAWSEDFGIAVNFQTPSKEEYVSIVIELAKRNKVEIPIDFLREQALNWVQNSNDFSGKSAKRFFNNILWEINNN